MNGRLFGVIGGVVMAAAGLIVGLVPVNNGKGLSCGRPFSTSPYVNLCASMANHQALAWTLLVGGVLVAGLSVLISRARPAGQIDQAVQTQLQALDAAYTRGDLTLEAHDLAVRQIAQVSGIPMGRLIAWGDLQETLRESSRPDGADTAS